MPNADGTKSIKISEKTYGKLSRFVKKRKFKMGAYADVAILFAMHEDIKRETASKNEPVKAS